MKIDTIELDKWVSSRYITRQKHPTEDLYIYNYTPKAQFEKVWNEYTLMCRGLILDSQGNIKSRPFGKFFNLSETDPSLIPSDEKFEVFEKMDGSLGISYFANGKLQIATRGSFTSDQAQEANKMLLEDYLSLLKLDPSLTYLFEIIYPENRVVVDYRDSRELVLLAILDTETGKEIPYDEMLNEYGEVFPVVRRLSADSILSLDTLEKETSNKEGYVVKFESGLRVKFKFSEYVRLHRLIFGVNKRSIWDLLRNNQPFDELLERVPDEFFWWVKQTVSDLNKQYTDIEFEAAKIFKKIVMENPEQDRKSIALQFSKYKDISSLLFAMLDKRDHSEIIWKKIRPTADLPFKLEL